MVEAAGRRFLEVEPEALRLLTETAIHDISHYLRSVPPRPAPQDHRRPRVQRQRPLRRPRPAEERLASRPAACCPMCQDTGTAIVMGKRGRHVLTDGARRRAHLPRRLRRLHQAEPALLPDGPADHVGGEEHRLQPARPDRAVRRGPDGHADEYKFLFMAKGGGSANKSFLYQETKAVLNEKRMLPVPGGEDPLARHRRLPAVPPGDRRRRHLRRVRAEDRQVRLAPATWTPSPPRAPPPATASATWSWRRRSSS